MELTAALPVQAALVVAAGGAAGALLLAAPAAQAAQYGAHEVHGDIEAEYLEECGPSGVLGNPVTDETPTPDAVGRYNAFSLGGSIYWTPATGAHEVHGAIRDTWSSVAWESGPLGYPITDETSTPGVLGRYNAFQRGSVYWSPSTGAHEVYGAIREEYASLGWEGSALGFPTSGEHGTAGGRTNTFEGGTITWTPGGGAVVQITNALPPRLAPTPVPTCPAVPPSDPGPQPPPPPGPTPPGFANCTAMHDGGYPHGIGRPGAVDSTAHTPVTTYYVSEQGYQNNVGSDRDHDGIACEA